MRYPDRVTVCVSTQAGCAMACQFCATGQAGFQRHLSQRRDRGAGGRPPCGRPGRARLQRRVHGDGGTPGQLRPGAGALSCGSTATSASRPATSPLSTVGIVPGIRRLADEALPVNLAVSLHAANDRLRDELRAHQPSLSAAHARRGVRGLRRGERPASLHRVGADRRRQRPGQRCRRAGSVRPSARRAREPDPAQPDSGLSRGRLVAGPGTPLP